MMARSPRSFFGEYEVITSLHRGGMGEILLGRRRGSYGFEKLVAIKTIRPELSGDPRIRAMLLDEARLLARIAHSAVVQIYDLGESEDTVFIVMEYVAGISLHELRGRRPSPSMAVRIMAEVFRGLDSVHGVTDRHGQSLGVVHRDVSPDNVMLGFDGGVKLIDFGIALAKNRYSHATQQGEIKGKPAYMSPEQIRNEPVDRRSDIFAGTVVLYELLTGEPLFIGDSLYSVARAVTHADIPPPSKKIGGLPEGLDEVVMKGLARDPRDRFGEASEVACQLEEIASNAGGESLSVFVRRTLDDDRRHHEHWLMRILGAGPMAGTPSPIGRPPGVHTLCVGDGASLDSASTEQNITPLGPITRILGSRRARWIGAGLASAFVVVMMARLDVDGLLGKEPKVEGRLQDVSAELTEPPNRESMEPPNPELMEPPKVERPAASVSKVGSHDISSIDVTAARRKRPRTARSRKVRSKARPLATRSDPIPAPSPPPSSVVAKGYLTVAAEPFAFVWVDGQDVGVTPVVQHVLPVGEHEVVLISPEDKTVRMRRMVTVDEGVVERVIVR